MTKGSINTVYVLSIISNAIFLLNSRGIQWQTLDSKYSPWQTVFDGMVIPHFTKFKEWDIWANIFDAMVKERKRQERYDTPSDSQSV